MFKKFLNDGTVTDLIFKGAQSGHPGAGGVAGMAKPKIKYSDFIAGLHKPAASAPSAADQIKNDVLGGETGGSAGEVASALAEGNKYAKLPKVGTSARVVANAEEVKAMYSAQGRLEGKINAYYDKNNTYSPEYAHERQRVDESMRKGMPGAVKAAVSRVLSMTNPTKAILGALAWENENFHGVAALYRNHAAVLMANGKVVKEEEI